MTTGERIRYCRERVNITQGKLAELSGLHPVSIRKYETNKMTPQPAQLRKIADALGVSYNALAGMDASNFILETDGDLMGLLLMLCNFGILKIDGDRNEIGVIQADTAMITVNPVLWTYFDIKNKSKSITIPLSDTILSVLDHDMLEKLLAWEGMYTEWEMMAVIFKIAKNSEDLINELTEKKEKLEIELQCGRKYLDTSFGVNHTKTLPDYSESPSNPILDFIMRKKSE